MARGKKKRKGKFRPFRLIAVLMGVALAILAIRFPSQAVGVEQRNQDLREAAEAYYNAQAENNRLRAEANEIDSSDFIERIARRQYGYCWYGETIYTVGNPDQLDLGHMLDEELELRENPGKMDNQGK